MKSAILATALLVAGGAAYAQPTPEVDARGIPVVSEQATPPAGTNQPVPQGVPIVAQPNPGAFAPRPATEVAPPCTRERTDRCVQTYERGRAR
jgi:hypothetical protein